MYVHIEYSKIYSTWQHHVHIAILINDNPSNHYQPILIQLEMKTHSSTYVFFTTSTFSTTNKRTK